MYASSQWGSRWSRKTAKHSQLSPPSAMELHEGLHGSEDVFREGSRLLEGDEVSGVREPRHSQQVGVLQHAGGLVEDLLVFCLQLPNWNFSRVPGI